MRSVADLFSFTCASNLCPGNLTWALVLFTVAISSHHSEAQTTSTSASGSNKGTNLVFKLDLTTADAVATKVNISISSYKDRAWTHTMEGVALGSTSITVTNLVDGEYGWKFTAPGYAGRTHFTRIRNGTANTNDLAVKLFRQRYVVLRYVFNTIGRRNLQGDEVETGRFAVTHWNGLPYFNEDWQVWQRDNDMDLDFHRIGPGFGFAKPPENVPFDDLKEAPSENSAYSCQKVTAFKGLTLFGHVSGHTEKPVGYGKLIVEDITEVPPQGIKVRGGFFDIVATEAQDKPSSEKKPGTNFVFKFNLSTADGATIKAKVKLIPHQAPRPGYQTIENVPVGITDLTFTNLTDGDYSWQITAPGYVGQTRFSKIRNGAAATNDFAVTLFRQRYVVLRYAFNNAGARSLQGNDVETGRLAVAHWGGLPHFREDWQIWQVGDGSGADGNIMNLDFHRYSSQYGFSVPPQNVSYDDLKEAPANDAYECRDTRAFKGLILFCRLEGNSAESSGYGKIMVEDITDTPPEGVKVVDVSAR